MSDTTAERESDADLEAVRRFIEHLAETNDYYQWLDLEICAVEPGFVRMRLPYESRLQPPEVAPGGGLNGGVIMTIADAAGMAAIIAEEAQQVGLTTAGIDLTFHESIAEPHVFEGSVVNAGNTLSTAQIEVVPESEVDDPDRTVAASGQATARLFR